MDSKQIDTAMRERTPVSCDGILYDRILEYISWYDNQGNHRLSVVLKSLNKRYTVRVPAEKVRLVDDG